MTIQEISVKKTTVGDFEIIYPLLLAFDSPFTKEDWSHIFQYQWDGVQDHVGYHLEKNGKIVGFMSLIFSITKVHLHYISNVQFFNESIKAILSGFKKLFGLFSALYLDKRFLSNDIKLLTFTRKINFPKIYKSTFSNDIGIDSLYSESVLL